MFGVGRAPGSPDGPGPARLWWRLAGGCDVAVLTATLGGSLESRGNPLMRVSAVSHLGKGLARPRGAGPARSLQGRTRSAAGLLRLETALEEFVDQQFDMLALDLHHAVLETAAGAAAPLQRAGQLLSASPASGRPLMVVTVLPPRPLVSRRTRAIPSPTGATACPQMQASLGCWQSGQCRPPSVEYTSPPRADRDEAFDHRAFPQNGLDGPGQQRWPAGADRDAPLRQGLRRGGMGTARKGRAI